MTSLIWYIVLPITNSLKFAWINIKFVDVAHTVKYFLLSANFIIDLAEDPWFLEFLSWIKSTSLGIVGLYSIQITLQITINSVDF